jgi:hypothetical protein
MVKNFIKEYNDLFSEIIVRKLPKKDGAVDWVSKYGIASEDWEYFALVFDVVRDVNYAIENFLQFGFGGPTKCEPEGEKVLRLYGVLGSVYRQKEALDALAKIVKLKMDDDKIGQLTLIRLRHDLGVHGFGQDKRDKGRPALYIVEIHGGGMCDIMHLGGGCPNGSDQGSYDFNALIEEYLISAADLYDKILYKLIGTVFKNEQKSGKHTFLKKLETIRFKRKGGIVINEDSDSPRYAHGPGVDIPKILSEGSECCEYPDGHHE